MNAIKIIILVLLGMLIGVCCYAVFSGTLSTEDPTEETNMTDIILTDENKKAIERVMSYYDITYNEALNMLLNYGGTYELGIIAQAEEWERKVREMES